MSAIHHAERDHLISTLVGVLAGLVDEEPDAIAEVFRKEKITGIRSSDIECPVAVYTERKMDEMHANITAVSVSYSMIELQGQNKKYVGQVPTPESIEAFIEAFDDGQYPDLEREEEDA